MSVRREYGYRYVDDPPGVGRLLPTEKTARRRAAEPGRVLVWRHAETDEPWREVRTHDQKPDPPDERGGLSQVPTRDLHLPVVP
jgi:hypothetical protein